MNNRNIEQWLIVIGIMFTHYVEAAIMFLVCLLIFYRERKVFLSKEIVVLLMSISILSIINITSVGYDYSKFIQQMALLTYFVVAYYIIFRSHKNDIPEIFNKYVKLIYWLCLIGLLQFIVFAITNTNIFSFLTHFEHGQVAKVAPRIIRVHSLFEEPSGLSTISTPALIYFILKENLTHREKRMRNIIILTMILTFSAITILMLFISIPFKYIFVKKNKTIRALSLFTFIGLTIYITPVFLSGELNKNDSDKNAFTEINNKINESINGIAELEPNSFELLNLSSYATLSNIWVSINAPNRIFGTGLGTHEQNYYSTYHSNYQYYGLNAKEAYSLLTRIFSEFGIFGVLIMILFLYKNSNKDNIINLAVLFIIITLMIRGGHYVRNGSILFFFIYYYTSTKSIQITTKS